LNNSSIDILSSDLENLIKVTNIATYWDINIDCLRDPIYEFLLEFTEISYNWTWFDFDSDSDSKINHTRTWSDFDSNFNSDSESDSGSESDSSFSSASLFESDSDYLKNLRKLKKILIEVWPETLFKHETIQILGMDSRSSEKSLYKRAGTVSVPFLEYIFALKEKHENKGNILHGLHLGIETFVKALEEGYTDCFKYLINKGLITTDWYNMSLYDKMCGICLQRNRKDCFVYFIDHVYNPVMKETFIRIFMDLIQKIRYKDINEDFLTYIDTLGFIEYVYKDRIFVRDIHKAKYISF
jgi:hypothetical protein